MQKRFLVYYYYENNQSFALYTYNNRIIVLFFNTELYD